MTVCMQQEPLPVDADERLTLLVFRFIGAAYETGDAACWEAAHAHAEGARGPFEGSLRVAQVAAMLRLIRSERPRFGLLPPLSRWLSSNEAQLMTLIRRAHEAESPFYAAQMLPPGAASERLITAARALTGRPGSTRALHSDPRRLQPDVRIASAA